MATEVVGEDELPRAGSGASRSPNLKRWEKESSERLEEAGEVGRKSREWVIEEKGKGIHGVGS